MNTCEETLKELETLKKPVQPRSDISRFDIEKDCGTEAVVEYTSYEEAGRG